jgi:hypothetical protein
VKNGKKRLILPIILLLVCFLEKIKNFPKNLVLILPCDFLFVFLKNVQGKLQLVYHLYFGFFFYTTNQQQNDGQVKPGKIGQHKKKEREKITLLIRVVLK